MLESIFEPSELHFYAERPAQGFAVAGAEAVLEFSATGPGRFAAARDHIARVLADTIAVGPLDEPFAGPHFFFANSFAHEAAANAPFPALRLFVPRWQVARMGDSTVAVANLLANARVHTPEGTRVTAALGTLEGRAIITVTDTGPGIPAEVQPVLFERFARGSAARHRVGTGLGLSLVAEHAHAHGGEAWVEDRPGGGARFRVSFPEAV